MKMQRFAVFFFSAAACLVPLTSTADNHEGGDRRRHAQQMSAMGELAGRVEAAVSSGQPVAMALNKDVCLNDPECGEDGAQAPSAFPQDDDVVTAAPGGQAETSIAVDSTGQHVVIGYNDTRGFALNPVSLSGVLYSDDGGTTFTDAGQLPTPGSDVINGTKYPQVFGDPEIKYLGGCNFVYASIMVKKFPSLISQTRTVQTLSVHRSTDCGHTWQGPFEVTAATNPNDITSAAGTPQDAADKEFMDVDPETGRILLSWSNFTPVAAGGVEISTTYSDNILAANPTWSKRAVVAATIDDGQSSIPRFAGNGSNEAYIAWRRFPSQNGNQVGFARSVDNGATWSAPLNLGPEFFTMDQVLGNDRVNTSPSVAVDNSHGSSRGNVYVVYTNNNTADGGDIVFKKSRTGGASFLPGFFLNSRPGRDRAQWFPWVTVDQDTGRISVYYYDQGIADSGDLTQVSYTYSDDGGSNWKQPQALTDRSFHAGWGNDTGQPNLGDYIQAVAQNGKFYAAYALASRPPDGFTDGQPSGSMTVPNVEFKSLAQFRHRSRPTTVDLQGVSISDSGGNGAIDPNEVIKLRPTLRNYVTNTLNARKLEDVEVKLSTTTPGVVIGHDDDAVEINNLAPGESVTPRRPFVLRTTSTFKPGTPIELVFTARGEERGDVTLRHTLFTGTPVATTLFAQDFNSVVNGVLPAGWSSVHAGGANVVAWTTSSSFCGATSNAAFHQNADDNGLLSPVRFERLFSPAFVVPGDAEYVTVDMDVCYDTEDDPSFNVLAYDGLLLRVTDLTAGRLLRSVLVEAAEDEFTTGDFNHYPKHFPRSSNPNYFQDMSAWAGDSTGWKHVRFRMPGMAGSTAQLRFEFTQDSGGTCADVRPGHACGVAVDNIVVKSVVSKPAQ